MNVRFGYKGNRREKWGRRKNELGGERVRENKTEGKDSPGEETKNEERRGIVEEDQRKMTACWLHRFQERTDHTSIFNDSSNDK